MKWVITWAEPNISKLSSGTFFVRRWRTIRGRPWRMSAIFATFFTPVLSPYVPKKLWKEFGECMESRRSLLPSPSQKNSYVVFIRSLKVRRSKTKPERGQGRSKKIDNIHLRSSVCFLPLFRSEESNYNVKCWESEWQRNGKQLYVGIVIKTKPHLPTAFLTSATFFGGKYEKKDHN